MFVEVHVVAFIENEVENETNIFKLSELHTIYKNCLQGIEITTTPVQITANTRFTLSG